MPLNPPAFHPFNPLLALRVSSLPLQAPQRLALITALFRAVWVDRLHVSEGDVVVRLANDLGLAGATLVAEAHGSSRKDRLRAQTDEAIARGVFGVPSMEVDGELFWGYDDFPYLGRFLAGTDPLNPAEWRKWHGPARPSAVRRRFRSQRPR